MVEGTRRGVARWWQGIVVGEGAMFMGRIMDIGLGVAARSKGPLHMPALPPALGPTPANRVQLRLLRVIRAAHDMCAPVQLAPRPATYERRVSST